MIAWLGMYDFGPLQAANDRFWQALRRALGDGPERLSRDLDPWQAWTAPDLLLAQTCGLPFRSRLHDRVTLVATPDHRLPGCPPGYYRSVLIARADATARTLADFAGGTFAYNDPLSQSGWAAPLLQAERDGVCFGAMLETGAHVASARAVADGAADVAGIDALTWQLLKDHDPALTRRLTPIGVTVPTPALPYITAPGGDAPALRHALGTAIAALSPADRQSLHLHGVVEIPAHAYLALPIPHPV
ncbi:phosphate/phosphite/phosphonate ABC transporter substrate-binding protein [Pseudodonghicola flavimaris]|uniref:PhnD/SsuA/transferrin family substrate-binding protein n=1 Tax=Pseudodonghicola flavimaris TaxID=3050036 RepID=A0ABT7EUR2_9RHOB|nr:PhnD/SsuA/transferrin family substrate-binding protein [Pseudodonghicola flavimaris]MDK3016087.1 PhnD/SsuA/transferrin family substrate-binding protein [Pseudodonghicola flavimaris]